MIQDLFFWSALIVSVFTFWILPPQLRNPFLAVFSAAVLGFYDWESCFLLFSLSLFQFFFLSTVLKRSLYSNKLLFVNLFLILAPLIYFKANLVRDLDSEISLTSAGDLLVPLGISYYSFRIIHVTLEAYRKQTFEYPARDYFCYIFLFTIILAGPIQRIDKFFIESKVVFDPQLVLDGLLRISYGIVKQTAVIDVVNKIKYNLLETDSVNITTALTVPHSSLWIILFSSYIISYLNLSAYSDIAIGSSRLFGFRIMENFNLPFLATSLAEFWRRWHMTLSGWCQTYIYLPTLGFSRNPYLALIISFQVMGLWHVFSLNRVAWGLFHAFGVIIAIEWARYARKKRIQVAQYAVAQIAFWVFTQAFISASWVFVLSENQNDIGSSLSLLLKLATFGFL